MGRLSGNCGAGLYGGHDHFHFDRLDWFRLGGDSEAAAPSDGDLCRTAVLVPSSLSLVIVGLVLKLILMPIWGMALRMLDSVGLIAMLLPRLNKKQSLQTALADLYISSDSHAA